MKRIFLCLFCILTFFCCSGQIHASDYNTKVSGVGLYNAICSANIVSYSTQISTVTFAYYKNERLINLSSREIILKEGNNIIVSDIVCSNYDNVKVMVWNNLFSLAPSAFAYTQTSDNLSPLDINRLSVLWPGITAEITNNTAYEIEAVIYIAVYDETDRIITTKTQEKFLTPGKTVCFSDNIDIPKNCYLKMFVWEKHTMMPLTHIKVYTQEKQQSERIPDYVMNEAKRVVKNVKSAQSDDSLSFFALSDIHLAAHGTDTLQGYTKKSVKLAAQGIQLIDGLCNIDSMVLLGDYTTNRLWNAEECKDDFEEVERNFLYLMKNRPIAWLIGNHDINYRYNRDRILTEEELYTYIGSNSTYLQRDPKYPYKNYGYTDFPEQKIRMIMLNTIDSLTEFTPKKGESMKADWISAVQLQWLADTALDFSDKKSPSEWGIVLIGHHPLNYNKVIQRALTILEAYRDGTAGTIEYEQEGHRKITYDFTNGEKAEIICNFHGHSHNFGYSKTSSTDTLLEEDAPEILVEPWIWRICIPNAMHGRENEHATSEWLYNFGEFDSYGNPVYYRKSPGTQKATSFCVVTINRENREIHLNTFGAGIDRIIKY